MKSIHLDFIQFDSDIKKSLDKLNVKYIILQQFIGGGAIEVKLTGLEKDLIKAVEEVYGEDEAYYHEYKN